MSGRRAPTVGDQVRGGAGWCCVFTVVFFATLPFTGPAFVWTLRLILETLNSIGG